MASPILRTDTFTRANSSPGNPGGVLTDPAGMFYISSNQLTATADNVDNSTNPQFWAINPAGDNGMTLNHGVVAYFKGEPGNYSTDGNLRLLVRVDPTNNYAYVLDINFAVNEIWIRKFLGGTRTNLVTPTTFAPGVANLTTADFVAWFAAYEGSSGTVTLNAKLYKATDVASPLITLTITDSDSSGALQTSSQVGLGYVWVPHFERMDTFAYDGVTDPALTAIGISVPTPALTLNSSTSVTWTMGSDCTGGTGPYTKQLTRCATPNGTYTNVGGTTTGLTLTDATATPATPAYYRIAATDSTSGTPLTNVSRTVGATPYASDEVIALGCIGDSVLANRPHDSADKLGLSSSDPTISAFTPFASACKYLELLPGGPRKVIGSNQALGGTTAENWAPAVANLAPSAYAMTIGDPNADVGTGYLYTAIQVFLGLANPPTHCLVSFGINDCNPNNPIPAATFGASMRDICSALVGNGITPILDWDTYIQDGSDNIWGPADMDLYVSYQAQIDSLINGATILDGRSGRYQFGMNNTSYFEAAAGVVVPTLGVHPDWDMGHFYGASIGLVLARILGLSGSGSGSGSGGGGLAATAGPATLAASLDATAPPPSNAALAALAATAGPASLAADLTTGPHATFNVALATIRPYSGI